ncbi:MAG: energy transducer TonB [Candidatus Desantisbacteria bacterium]
MEARALNRPLVVSIIIHLTMAMLFWFIVIKPPRQIQRLIEVSLIELPTFKVQDPPPEIESVKPKKLRMRKEMDSIPLVKPQVRQNYQQLFNRDVIPKPQQIIEQPIRIEKPSPLLVEPPTNRVVAEEKHDISLPVARSSELLKPKEDVIARVPAAVAIAPAPPAPHFAKGTSIQIEGVGNRKVKYQPMFAVPKSVEEKGVNLSGSLKFWVSPDGSVDRVEVLKTCGSSEADSNARNAVYRWRFEELSEEQERAGGSDWGAVKFRIQLN